MYLQMYLNQVLMDDDELQGYLSLSGIDYTKVNTLSFLWLQKGIFTKEKFCNYFCTINCRSKEVSTTQAMNKRGT